MGRRASPKNTKNSFNHELSLLTAQKNFVIGFGLSLDFSEAWADGISLSATITSSASYRFFGADATFESIAEDYDDAKAAA